MSNFNFKKKYGQNFLINESILNTIADSICPTNEDLIIEIGPGGGALTKKLKKYNSNLICFEIDQDTKVFLEKLVDDKTTIYYEDILETNIEEKISKIKYNNLYIIGNLPYYITTKIITSIISSTLKPKKQVFMVQKEVADRFTSEPGNREYGYITVLLNYFYNIERIIDVPKEDFNPMPKVDSAVVKFISKNVETVENFDLFNTFLKDCFKFKRKKLLNNLQKYNKDKILEVLNKKHYSENVRAEELSLEDFIDLYRNI